MLKLATFEDTALHVFHEAKEKIVTYHSKIVSCDNKKIFRENNFDTKTWKSQFSRKVQSKCYRIKTNMCFYPALLETSCVTLGKNNSLPYLSLNCLIYKMETTVLTYRMYTKWSTTYLRKCPLKNQ